MKRIEIDLTPEQYCTSEMMHDAVAHKTGIPPADISQIHVLRRSLDSRHGQLIYHTTAEVYGITDTYTPPNYHGHYQNCRNSTPVIIVGAGPAGLFAALRALELGLKPIIFERGEPVEKRKRDIAQMARNGQVNPSSNWCFGEGGAGTYSDGKLYTRSTKRGNVTAILERFVEHGASADILIDAHAHIGTDKLSSIIAQIRYTIENFGGEYHFGTQVTDLIILNGNAIGIVDSLGNRYEGCAVLLATGHSARDIYELFYRHGWLLEPKSFAIGVRVEHPQQLINEIQYHAHSLSPTLQKQLQYLPPAAYSLTTQVAGHGVFSFCMCPGGVIVPAATDTGQQVVNGMSNSQRNSPYANSGIAVTVGIEDVPKYRQHGPLALLRFQQEVEQKVFTAAGDSINAPIQRLTDFCQGRASTHNNRSNYLGTTTGSPIHEILPLFITRCLRQGFCDFDRKMHGFLTDQASILAVESRTSSPVRIPRNPITLEHLQLHNLYPVGEGAGYAGGIVSSALDGVKAMETIAAKQNIL